LKEKEVTADKTVAKGEDEEALEDGSRKKRCPRKKL